ncbi:MAG: hypothetical protein LC797_02590 [Chloroflexi bacterium]|nr:hypothetical protein [Chloroflexota bacterium]
MGTQGDVDVWDALPLEDQVLRHGKLSGYACFLVAENPKFKELPERNQIGVTSIYQGYMVASLHPDHGSMELLFWYGLGDYRWPDGCRYVTPLAEIEGDGGAFYAALQRTWSEGRPENGPKGLGRPADGGDPAARPLER